VDFTRPARPVPLRLVAGRGHYETVVQAVLEAEVSVWIATANLKELMVEDHRAHPGRRRGGKSSNYRSVLAAFAELVRRGVDVRLLHASPPSRPFRAEISRHRELVPPAFELRLCPRVHLKTVIVDGALAYLGSANWTGAGLGAKGTGRRNFELGVVSDDPQLLDEVQGLYDQIWRGSECGECKLREVCPGPLDEVEAVVAVRPAATAAKPGPARSRRKRRPSSGRRPSP
jgi:phosphatidylserine/phosphatidylglycerophosphate/cardiolipin synthase-like enzyme